MARRCRVGVVTLAAVLTAAGCSSDPRAPVAGKVMSGDKPLTAGEVRFHGPNSRFATTQIRADGSYSLPDAPVGDCKVTVHPPAVLLGKAGPLPKDVTPLEVSADGPGIAKAQPNAKPSGPAPPGAGGAGGPKAPGGLSLPDPKGSNSAAVIKDVLVPEKYQTPDATPLTFTVQKGDNTFDIKVTP